jgi:murein DD-endopeptidase MepM/ murein hydrolase activator NlpD
MYTHQKLNKHLAFLTFFIAIACSQNVFADDFKYSKIISQHQTEVLGQEIGNYQQRWFWEPESLSKTYTSFFYFENMKPEIIFINKADATPEHFEMRSSSLYHEFLKDNDLLLKRPPLKNWNYVSTGNSGHHQFENMSGNFAWDIVKIKKKTSFENGGHSNSDYHVWNEPVYAPISGTVLALERDAVDNGPDPSNTADLSAKGDGNYLLIHVYERFYFILMHFKKDSIPAGLDPGSNINAGDYIGNVGNSGVSYSPHLHMTMYYWSSELNRMISVPTLFKDIEVKNSKYGKSSSQQFFNPQTGQFVRTNNL